MSDKIQVLITNLIELNEMLSLAYAEDIFPDDNRAPCQTTAARMARHLVSVYSKNIEQLRLALAENQNSANSAIQSQANHEAMVEKYMRKRGSN